MTEEQVFLAALDLVSPADRAAYLDKACGGDVELRRQVEELLAAHFKTGAFLDEPVGQQLKAGSATPLTNHTLRQHPSPGGDTAADDPNLDDLSFLQPSSRPDALGRIGHYEVLQILGKGGFGIVFRAFDEVLQRVVALKVLVPALAATSPARKRFLREARAAAQVRHENVVQVHAVEEQPLPYLVMEFIPGESLQQRLDRTGPLEAAEIVRLGRQIAEGLAAAHATGLIHRDVKPANVLIEGGHQRARISDFGLARAADDASLTQSGVLAGTPMYMAPEQASGETLDHRADLFSLGSVLYVMATGRPPFRAATTYAVLKRVVEDDPRPIREVIPEVPPWLCAIIARLHAKKPADRFPSARAVADLLADCEARLQANARPEDFPRVSPGKPAAGWSGRWRWAAVAAVVLPLLVLATTETTGLTHWLRHPPATPGRLEYAGGDTERPGDPGPRTYWTNSLGMKFRLIPAGTFRMGSSQAEIDRCLREFMPGSEKFQEVRKIHIGAFERERLPAEGPEHQVEITQPFYMGITEVTLGQFRQFVDEKRYDVGDPLERWKKPGPDSSDNDPVVFVSWHNAVDFCAWLSAKEKKKYRLPTEAEWEYCCRAGRAGTRYCFGDRDEHLEQWAWHRGNAEGRAHPVGQLDANAWGLHDMHGNAWEWCQDQYDPKYYTNSPVKDPPGGAGLERAVRGGSWYWPPEFCRSAFRQFVAPGQRYSDLGFRVLLAAPPAGTR